jgi:hypothetical protein
MLACKALQPIKTHASIIALDLSVSPCLKAPQRQALGDLSNSGPHFETESRQNTVRAGKIQAKCFS